MKKFFAGVLALLMSAGILTGLSSPAQAGTWYCKDKMDGVSTTVQDGPRDTFVMATVMFRYCTNSDTGIAPRVKPYRVIGMYDVSGSYMTCSSTMRYLDGVTFNFYFWRPFTGENFNPGGFTVLCDESTTNSEGQGWALSDVPWLEYGPGYGSDRQPRWKVNVTVRRNMNTDLHWAHAQDFNPS